MGDEAQIKLEQKVDPTLFRSVQQLATQARDVDILKEVYEDAKQFSINGEPVQDKRLIDFVEQWVVAKNEPYSVEYFDARDISMAMREDFKTIDNYIISKLKEANQETSIDSYKAFIKKLEKSLGLTEHSETMHRITEILRFIENGNKRFT